MTRSITSLTDSTLRKMNSPTHRDEKWLKAAYSRALAGTRPQKESITWVLTNAQNIDPALGDSPLWTWPLPNF